MPLGQNLKLRAALGTGTSTATGRFSTAQYLAGGAAGRVRQWTAASFTLAVLFRLTDRATAQYLIDTSNGATSWGFLLEVSANTLIAGIMGTANASWSTALNAADVGLDCLAVVTTYTATSRQLTLNGRRVATNATNTAVGANAAGVPTIGVKGVTPGVASPFLGGIYDIAISYEVALAAADQQAFFEQVVAEGGLPSSLNGTRWSHFMHAEDYSGDVSRGQVQLGDRASGVNWKLPVAANGSPTTLNLSPLRPLVFGPTG